MNNTSNTWKDLEIEEIFMPEWNIECEKNHENSGAWILSYENGIMLYDKWRLAIDLYQSAKLTGITSMKICAMNFSVTSTSAIQGIWFYCNPSNNENIKEIGTNICNKMVYHDNTGSVYYNSKKDIAKMTVPKYDPFQKGLILLEAQKKFAKGFANKIELYVELLKSISHQKELPHIAYTIKHFKLNQKDLNRAYEELHKRWSDSSQDYGLNISVERYSEFSEEESKMTIDYMTQKFDSLHHFMHHEMIESLKHFKVKSQNSLMFRKMFDDLAVKFWCRNCNMENKICQKCRSGYFSLPADRIRHILEKASIEFQHKAKCSGTCDGSICHEDIENDISIEELRITKVALFDMAKASYPVFDRDTFDYKVKTINQMIIDRLGDVLGENQEFTVVDMTPEKENKLSKMRQRKEAKKVRAEKKVKTVVVEEDQEKPYDFEKVLEALGEVN